MNLDLRVLLVLGIFGEGAKDWAGSEGVLLEDDHPP